MDPNVRGRRPHRPFLNFFFFAFYDFHFCRQFNAMPPHHFGPIFLHIRTMMLSLALWTMAAQKRRVICLLFIISPKWAACDTYISPSFSFNIKLQVNSINLRLATFRMERMKLIGCSTILPPGRSTNGSNKALLDVIECVSIIDYCFYKMMTGIKQGEGATINQVERA